MRLSAVHIFAFDALIENDDRRQENQNILVRGDDMFVIDHEAAFSFLHALGPRRVPPWEVRNRSSLRRHLFYYQLRRRPVDLSLFTARLADLGDSELEHIVREVPDEWRHGDLHRISAHLQSVCDHAADFERQVLEALASMIPYSFSVLRYVYDIVTAEFVNIGMAVYSGDASYLSAKCTIQYGRITRVFDRIDGDRFKQMIRYIEEEVARLGQRLNQQNLAFAELPTTIEGLLKMILPPDDSAIQFSPAGFGVSSDLDRTLAELYERYVERYAGGQEVPSRSDEEVWRIFRDPLERRSVLAHLVPKKIIAPDYEYQFRAAWKNEAWHVYEPVSFDLVEPNSLLEKANRWVGRSTNLAESTERFRMHLLIGKPQDARLQPTFSKAQNILRKMPGNPELILESDAESFAADLERDIAIHGGGTQRVLDLP